MTAALETTEALLAKAKVGTKLTPVERRKVIRFLDEGGDERKEYSNRELAKLFSVDEAVIRKDKKKILALYTRAITPDHAMLYVGDYLKAHDDLIRKAEDGLRKANPGTMAHQTYLKILSDLKERQKKMLQEIGALPKHLGQLNVTEEHWVATVNHEGVTEVHEAPPAENAPRALPGEILDDDGEEFTTGELEE
jgi:hypothetical protein